MHNAYDPDLDDSNLTRDYVTSCEPKDGDHNPNLDLPIEYIAGEEANYCGLPYDHVNEMPYDREQSEAWCAGWDAAEVAREEWEARCLCAGDGFVLE